MQDIRGDGAAAIVPRRQVQDIRERSDGISGRLANVGLLDQRLVEERHRVLLLLVGIAGRIAALGLFPRGGAWDVDPHLHELVLPGRGSLARALLAVRAILVQRKLDGDLVAPGEVGVGDLRIRDFEGRPVLHVEGQLGLAKLGLAPVPAAERVLLVLQRRAVPVLEDLAETLVVFLREAVQLDDAGVALQDLHLVAARGSAPLCAADVALVQCEGLTAGRRLPAQSVLGKPALAGLFGEIQVDVIETLSVESSLQLAQFRRR